MRLPTETYAIGRQYTKDAKARGLRRRFLRAANDMSWRSNLQPVVEHPRRERRRPSKPR